MSIADLIQRQGEVQAQGLRESGRIWGQLATDLGQIPGRTYGQILEQRQTKMKQDLEATQLQSAQLALKEQQKKAHDSELVGQAYQQSLRPDGTFDRQGLLSRVASVSPDLVPTVTEQMDSLEKSGAALQEQKIRVRDLEAEHVGELARTVRDHQYDPGAFGTAMALAQSQGLDVSQAQQALASGASIQDITDRLIAQAPSAQAARKTAEAEAAKPVVLGPGQRQFMGGQMTAEGGPAAPEWTVKTGIVDGKDGSVRINSKDGTMINVATGRPTTDFKERPSQAAVNIQAGTLSDAALDQAARKYLDSGVLPPGMGGMAQRTAIQNRAAQLDPTAALARNAATFKADSANLANLQKTEGTLSAFEKTAGKNLDQFLALADKIPDAGVPWLNTPVRALSASVVGSEHMAAINAARDVALREIARVTNDPKLSGALTDSARAEVLGLSPQNATLPQIKAVAKVLKQDMANVHAGINEQIAAVKGAIGSQPPATGSSSAAIPDNVRKALQGATNGTHTLSDGSVWVVKDGQINKAGG